MDALRERRSGAGGACAPERYHELRYEAPGGASRSRCCGRCSRSWARRGTRPCCASTRSSTTPRAVSPLHRRAARGRWRASRRSTAPGSGSAAGALDPVLRRLLRSSVRRRCCASSATWMPRPHADLDATAAAPGLRVGYLHLGKAGEWRPALRPDRRGGRRAAAGRGGRRGRRGRPRCRRSGTCDARPAACADADVVHLQWKLADWGGPRWRAAAPRGRSSAACRRPLVVTLHDVYASATAARERWLDRGALGAAPAVRSAARLLVVHSDEERRRLGGMVAARHARRSSPTSSRSAARLPDRRRGQARAGPGGSAGRSRSLGFMTRRKGHRLVLEALPLAAGRRRGHLRRRRPSRVARPAARSSRRHARELGVADRVRFTGYVPDDELTRDPGRHRRRALPLPRHVGVGLGVHLDLARGGPS